MDELSVDPQSAKNQTPVRPANPSPLRAWFYLIWLSIQRQMRAHLMVWISLGLLAFTVFVVSLVTQAGRWDMEHWRYPRRHGMSYRDFVSRLEIARVFAPWSPSADAVLTAANGTFGAVLRYGTGFIVFSRWAVFVIFTTFLLPIWSLSFATEGLGREREARNLIWLLTRPLSRPAIYLAKYLAVLPSSIALNLGGFCLICWAGGEAADKAFPLYWHAVLLATLAFCALFHLMGAILRRPAVVAILYAFFLETFMGNLPGHLKRLSISFYTRCIMFSSGQKFGVQPERPLIYLPVSGSTATWILIGVTVALLAAGMWLFSRREYADLA